MSKCNPLSLGEIIGREYIESQIPSRDSLKVRRMIDNIDIINQTSIDINDSIEKIKELHGPYTGPSEDITSFTKNLFSRNPNFRQSILEIESTIIGIKRITRSIERVEDLTDGITFQDLSTSLLRAYLRNTRILLPDNVKRVLDERLDEVPFFAQISDAIGSIYSNIIIPDNAVNMIDNIIGNVLDETGLSSVLNNDTWGSLIPEYALNFHDNIRLFQRLGSRVLPKCTFGKLYHVMDEPLAHFYNLAQDAFGFLDVLNNRKFYLNLLFQRYGDLARLINGIYPMCQEYTLSNDPILIKIENEKHEVDILGNKLNSVKNSELTDSFDGLVTG